MSNDLLHTWQKSFYLCDMKANRGSRSIGWLILNLALARAERSTSRPRHFNLNKEIRYSLNRDLGKLQSRSGRIGEEKNFFEFLILQPVSWVYRLRYYRYLTTPFVLHLGAFQGTVYRFYLGTEANPGRAATVKGYLVSLCHVGPLPKQFVTCCLRNVLKNLCSGNLPLFFS
jgi:hypothetical protein